MDGREEEGKISEFNLKLLDIEMEQLGVPEGEEQHQAEISLPSGDLMKAPAPRADRGGSQASPLQSKNRIKWYALQILVHFV